MVSLTAQLIDGQSHRDPSDRQGESSNAESEPGRHDQGIPSDCATPSRRPESSFTLFPPVLVLTASPLPFTQRRGLLSTDSIGDSGVCVVSAQRIQHSAPSCECQTRSLGFFDAQTTREDPQDEMWRPNQF